MEEGVLPRVHHSPRTTIADSLYHLLFPPLLFLYNSHLEVDGVVLTELVEGEVEGDEDTRATCISSSFFLNILLPTPAWQ